MSGENQNIAIMAEKASKEIFEVFGWRQVGPKNQNWACVEPEKHDWRRSRSRANLQIEALGELESSSRS